MYLFVYAFIYFGGSIYHTYLFREELSREENFVKKNPPYLLSSLN